jgi:hypothetical protein
MSGRLFSGGLLVGDLEPPSKSRELSAGNTTMVVGRQSRAGQGRASLGYPDQWQAGG